MLESSPSYVPTTIAKVFELLDHKLVSLGIPGALAFVGITKARESQWSEAAGCFAGAVGVWLIIKIGNKLAPKLDQGLDWLIAVTERSLLEGIFALRSDFEGQYLKRQAGLCDEFEVEGFTPDKTAILLVITISRSQITRLTSHWFAHPTKRAGSDRLSVFPIDFCATCPYSSGVFGVA